jgi:hypothetical protein
MSGNVRRDELDHDAPDRVSILVRAAKACR